MSGTYDEVLQVAKSAMRTHQGGEDPLPHMVAAAVLAGQRAATIQAVRVMTLKPGDIVLFQLGGVTDLEFDEFSRSMDPLKRAHPGVQFAASEMVEGVQVLRFFGPATQHGLRIPSVQELQDEAARNKPTLPTDVRRPESEGGWDGRRG